MGPETTPRGLLYIKLTCAPMIYTAMCVRVSDLYSFDMNLDLAFMLNSDPDWDPI